MVIRICLPTSTLRWCFTLKISQFLKIMKNWESGTFYSKFNADYESSILLPILIYFSDIFNFVAPFFATFSFLKRKEINCTLLNFKEAPAVGTGCRQRI